MTRPTQKPDWASDTNIASGPSTGSTTKEAPTSGELAQGFVPGQTFKSRRVNWLLNLVKQWIDHADDDYMASVFGTSTATVTISSNDTLTAPGYYGDLTISSGARLTTHGYPIFVSGTLTIESGCAISDNGGDAPTPSAGDALGGTGAIGDFSGNGAGGDGGTGAVSDNSAPAEIAATAGGNVTNSLGGVGNRGGHDSGTPSADLGTGGAGGTRTLPISSEGGYRHFRHDLGFTRSGAIMGGAGGGGGGVDDDAIVGIDYGGGGGGGGGCVIIIARLIVNEGAIEANGGAGADAIGDSGLAGGGGGGGGGGYVAVAYRSLSGAGVIRALGGAAGSGRNGGQDGLAGDPAATSQFQL